MKMNMKKTLVLSKNDVQQILTHYGLNQLMDELIERTTLAIKNYDPNNTVIPARSGFNYEKPYTGLVEWMPTFEREKNVTIKIVGYHPHNPSINNLPTILSTVSLYDVSSGHLMGLMDGVLLTALRTGAASAIASKILAAPNSQVLGLIGCGAQSITQLHAMSRIFDLQKVLIYDVDIDTALSFQHRCEILDLPITIQLSDVEEIVQQSDIICTATSIGVGEGPLFNNLPPQPHLHLNAVGSDFPGKTELPIDLLKKSFVCPDFLDQALVEGECQQLSTDQIADDLIKVTKHPSAYHFYQNKLTVFDSTGWALEDQIAMEVFMNHAQRLGLGQEIEIEIIPEDVKNPYHFMSKKVIGKQNC